MSRTRELAPWQVWLVDFGQPIGHEQGGMRPAVVVGSLSDRRYFSDGWKPWASSHAARA